MGADFAPLVVETHGRFHSDFIQLLKRLAIQIDGYQGLTAREMAVIVIFELAKGNAEHAAKVRSRAWRAWLKQSKDLLSVNSRKGALHGCEQTVQRLMIGMDRI